MCVARVYESFRLCSERCRGSAAPIPSTASDVLGAAHLALELPGTGGQRVKAAQHTLGPARWVQAVRGPLPLPGAAPPAHWALPRAEACPVCTRQSRPLGPLDTNALPALRTCQRAWVHLLGLLGDTSLHLARRHPRLVAFVRGTVGGPGAPPGGLSSALFQLVLETRTPAPSPPLPGGQAAVAAPASTECHGGTLGPRGPDHGRPTPPREDNRACGAGASGAQGAAGACPRPGAHAGPPSTFTAGSTGLPPSHRGQRGFWKLTTLPDGLRGSGRSWHVPQQGGPKARPRGPPGALPDSRGELGSQRPLQGRSLSKRPGPAHGQRAAWAAELRDPALRVPLPLR